MFILPSRAYCIWIQILLFGLMLTSCSKENHRKPHLTKSEIHVRVDSLDVRDELYSLRYADLNLISEIRGDSFYVTSLFSYDSLITKTLVTPFSGNLVIENIQVDSIEFKNLGQFLNLIRVSEDTSILIQLNGLSVVSNGRVVDQFNLSQNLPSNYYFFTLTNQPPQIPKRGRKVYLLIGGEWDYPHKQYPSEMRFIFEYDLKNKSGRILPFVNPDFGKAYHLMGQTQLISIRNQLIVRYGIDSLIYKCDFESGRLNEIVLTHPPMHCFSENDLNLAELNDFQKQTKHSLNNAYYSSYSKLPSGLVYCIGMLPFVNSSNGNLNYAISYLSFVELINKDFQAYDRIFTGDTHAKPFNPIVINDHVLIPKKCENSSSADYMCYYKYTISSDPPCNID